MTTDQRIQLDSDMLEMLRGSLRHVLTDDSAVPLADRLGELGWDEVVETDAPTALRTLFELKGETLSSAEAIGPALAAKYAELGGELTTSLRLAEKSQILVVDQDGNDTATAVDDDTWTALQAHGRWLTACELVGIGRHVLESAVDYTKERVQYGKPIGVFQALQHRLAGAHAKVVGASHLAVEAGLDGDPWTALVAKCMAGQAAEHACTQAQQCYGAIGFTFEHEFPGYLQRTYALDRSFGDWRTLEHDIGDQLQQTGVVPRIGMI